MGVGKFRHCPKVTCCNFCCIILYFAAGDFGAVAKLANTHTGDVLTSSKDTTTSLEPINFPEPCFTVAVFPKSKADLDKMSNALARRAEEDRTLRVSRDP